jgi:KaiC/GvpD/RAD55 family RecA-like ATPase
MTDTQTGRNTASITACVRVERRDETSAYVSTDSAREALCSTGVAFADIKRTH